MSSGVCKRATTLCDEYSLAPGQSPMTSTAGYPRRLLLRLFFCKSKEMGKVLNNISHVSPQFRLHHNGRMWLLSSQSADG